MTTTTRTRRTKPQPVAVIGMVPTVYNHTSRTWHCDECGRRIDPRNWFHQTCEDRRAWRNTHRNDPWSIPELNGDN